LELTKTKMLHFLFGLFAYRRKPGQIQTMCLMWQNPTQEYAQHAKTNQFT